MRALLVVNPAATSTTSRVKDVLVSALSSDLKVEIAETTHRGHAAELGQRAAVEGLDLVIVLGGDGTINEVVNGMLTDGPRPGLPALGIVPGGSTNVFARALGIPADPVEATGALLAALRDGQIRTIGLGLANERYFTFTAGLGLDADAVHAVERARAKGRKATPQLYAMSAVRRFFRTDRRHPTMTLTINGEASDKWYVTIVSNTSPWTYIGSREVVMTPTASFDAGLDVVSLSHMRTIPTILAATRMLSKKGIRGRSVSRWSDLTEISVTASSPQPFQLDGDFLGEREMVRFASVPHALQVVVAPRV